MSIHKTPLSKNSTVSLVVPTHNRAESLTRTLEAIENLDIPDESNLEVMIVLDGCEDNSAAVVKNAKTESKHQISWVTTKGLGAGGARNRGVERSSGALIGFIDDDVIPEPSWLKKHVAWHEAQKAPVVTVGAMTLPSFMRLPAWNEWEVLSLQARYDELRSDHVQAKPSDFFTANAMVPREALIAVDGFDESLSRAEDVELAERLAKLGLQFEFLRDVTVVHCPVRSLKNWKRIPVNYAKSHIEMRGSTMDKTQNDLGAPKLENMHELTRLAVNYFSKREVTSAVYCTAAQLIGCIAHSVRLQKISYAAFSSVYNVLYFGTLHRLQSDSAESKV